MKIICQANFYETWRGQSVEYFGKENVESKHFLYFSFLNFLLHTFPKLCSESFNFKNDLSSYAISLINFFFFFFVTYSI